METKQIFIDGINSINFLNGMIRIGMGTMIPNTEENGEPTFSEDYRIIVPLNSFLAGFQSQKQIIDQLEERGVISKSNQENESSVIPDVVK